MESWAGISLSFVAANGNLKQLYPTWCPVGVVPSAATNGQQLRGPVEGAIVSLQVETDGTNGGIIQLWDLNGADVGADVSSLDVVTDAQLIALQALGRAKLMYEQNFTASGITPPTTGPRSFQHGLAARFVGSAGACSLNLSVRGGFRLTTKVG